MAGCTAQLPARVCNLRALPCPEQQSSESCVQIAMPAPAVFCAPAFSVTTARLASLHDLRGFRPLLQCPESLESGTCSFRSPLAAASTCIRLPVCRAVVVYPNGAHCCLHPAPKYLGSSAKLVA